MAMSAIYAILLVVNAEWPVAGAAAAGAMTIGVAGALGVPVWWLTSRLPIPSGLSFRFLSIHAICAFVYSVAWLAIDVWLAAFLLPDDAFRRRLSSMGWEAILGVWLYALIAASAYVWRDRLRLRAEQQRARDAELRANRARLDALRAQLNPHFLFNALHSIGSLARYDVESFDEALERLSLILRRALRLDADISVPLDEEVAFVRDYIAIEKIRFGDRLAVDIVAADDARMSLVPFLVIQPLVENAIRHAIEPSAAGGRIDVDIRMDDDQLRIRVSDTGTDVSPRPITNGTGLAALRERLSLLYGDSASLLMSANTPRGSEVSLRIPVRNAIAN